MTWVVAGLLAPLLWAFTNLIDQIKIRKYFTGSPLLITTLGCFLSLFIIIFISIFYPSIWSLPPKVGLVFSGTALFECLAFLAYYKALEKDEASNAVPIFQVLPIIIFILGYFFLGEVVSNKQIVGSVLIISGALCLMVDLKAKLFKWNTLGYMMLCCMVLAISTILNRGALEYANWYTAIAWKTLGFMLFFVLVFSLNKKIRLQSITHIKNPLNMGIALLVTVEIVGLLANALFMFSLEGAPAAGLAQTLNGFQPVYVLILGVLAYKVSPEHFEKPKTGFHLIWHLACLMAMLFGLYLIY